MKKTQTDKRIEKLEEKLDALTRHLKLRIIVEEHEDGEWYESEVIKRKKNRLHVWDL